MKRNASFSFFHHKKGHAHTDCLGEGGSKCRAHRSQVKRSHEKVVQHNIYSAGHGDKVHGTFGISQAAENRADDIVGSDKRNAEKADYQITNRSLHSFLRG